MIAFCGVYTRQNCEFNKREFSRIFPLAGGILPFQNGNSRWPWSTVGSRQSTSLATATTITVQDWSIGWVVRRLPVHALYAKWHKKHLHVPTPHPWRLSRRIYANLTGRHGPAGGFRPLDPPRPATSLQLITDSLNITFYCRRASGRRQRWNDDFKSCEENYDKGRQFNRRSYIHCCCCCFAISSFIVVIVVFAFISHLGYWVFLSCTGLCSSFHTHIDV